MPQLDATPFKLRPSSVSSRHLPAAEASVVASPAAPLDSVSESSKSSESMSLKARLVNDHESHFQKSVSVRTFLSSATAHGLLVLSTELLRIEHSGPLGLGTRAERPDQNDVLATKSIDFEQE
jgi:hypothetical protein